ncbi:MAG: hypothetical protein WDW38_006564 [Sanguina aurantia]
MDWGALLVEFGRAHPFLVVVNLVMILLVPLNEIVLPQWYGRLISAFQERRPLQAIFITVALLIVVTRLVTYIIEPIDARFTTELQTFVRDRALAALLATSETQGTLHNGDIIARLTKLPVCLETILGVWRNTIVPALLGFSFAAVYLSFHDRVLTLLVLSLAATFLVTILVVPRACAHTSLLRDESYNQIIEQIDDVLSNVVSVYSQSQQEPELAGVMARGDEYSRRYINTVHCYLPAYSVVTGVSMLFVCAYLYRTHTLMQKRSIDTAALVTIMFIMMFSLNSMNRSTGIIRPLTLQYGVLKGSTAILMVEDGAGAEVDAGHMARARPGLGQEPVGDGIELVDVSYGYPRRKVLDHVSVHFPAGKTTILWGSVGSGKSTMLKLLLRYKHPQGGELFLWGVPYSGIPSRDLRREIAYVPQVPMLFDRTILENMRYGTHATEEEVHRVALRLGLLDSLQRDLNETVGKGGALVSGGQRQLILIARALLTGSRVLIFDEPSSSLDDDSRTVLMKCLRALKRAGTTVIIVTHDEQMLEVADVVLTLQDGQIS